MHPAILLLRDYDSQNSTDFLQTLKVFLSFSGNQTLTADHLHIHRNTLKYRLSRLREIVGDDLDDPDQKLRMQLSFHIINNPAIKSTFPEELRVFDLER